MGTSRTKARMVIQHRLRILHHNGIAKLRVLPADEDISSLREDSEPKLDEYAELASSEMWLRSAHSKPCPDSACATEQPSNHRLGTWDSYVRTAFSNGSASSVMFALQHRAMWDAFQSSLDRASLLQASWKSRVSAIRKTELIGQPTTCPNEPRLDFFKTNQNYARTTKYALHICQAL